MISNSSFYWNGALSGGAYAAIFESQITCENCIFEKNFAIQGSAIFSYING